MIVISNGMLRSGSTLQYNVAACVLETAGALKRGGFVGDFGKPEVRAKLETLKAADGWTIIKTHEPPLERAFYDERVRVLFSYRDVRDIAASIRKKWRYPFEQILSDIDAMIEIERQFGDIPNVLVQSYNTLYHKLPEATRDIAEFLGIALTPKTLGAIAARNTLGTDGKVEAINSGLINSLYRLFGLRAYDDRTLLHHDHISSSRGRNGDWQNQFSPDEISTLNDRYINWLRAHSYLVA